VGKKEGGNRETTKILVIKRVRGKISLTPKKDGKREFIERTIK